MKTNYATPQIEVVEIEIEDAILQTSGIEDLSNGSIWGDEF